MLGGWPVQYRSNINSYKTKNIPIAIKDESRHGTFNQLYFYLVTKLIIKQFVWCTLIKLRHIMWLTKTLTPPLLLLLVKRHQVKIWTWSKRPRIKWLLFLNHWPNPHFTLVVKIPEVARYQLTTSLTFSSPALPWLDHVSMWCNDLPPMYFCLNWWVAPATR